MNEKLLNRNKNINRGFRKLEVWKELIELYVFVRKELQTRNSIPFKVQAQIEDSILSVPSNISEGYCRRSLKEYIRFINIALSSLGENYSQVFALHTAKVFDKSWFDEYDKKHYSIEN